jgi:hypothetical protein
MNSILARVLLVFAGVFLFSSFSGVFAAPLDDKYSSGTSDTRTSSYVSDQDSQKDDSQKGEETKKVDKPDALDEYQEKEKVQREINSYILEAYKIQGNKILKDIDISLQKINLDNETRIQAYARIQKTLEMRKRRVQNMDLSDNNKSILIKYLDYLISILKRRQAELKD